MPPPIGSADPAPAADPKSEFVLTVAAQPGETATAVFGRLAALLQQRRATVLSLMVYGAVAAYDEGRTAMERALGQTVWPIMWVEGAACHGESIAGVQAFAVAEAVRVRRVALGGRIVGSVYEDGAARHCLLAGIGPDDVAPPRAEQARQTFANLETALGQAGFALADVARTWFYNEDILAWYDDFNRVRTAYYAKKPFRTGSLPASTGVEGRNPRGAALAVGAWAVQPLEASVRVEEIASPLQCPAPAYGSSFSRAMEIASAGRQRVLVSGTASIAPGGESIWPGDARRQVGRTMEVVEAILHSRGLEFHDVTRATAYFKNPSDTAAFEAWRISRNLPNLPAVAVHCDICRDDLLFEIELDACATLPDFVRNGSR